MIGTEETFALVEEAVTYFDVTTPDTSSAETEAAGKVNVTDPATIPQQ